MSVDRPDNPGPTRQYLFGFALGYFFVPCLVFAIACATRIEQAICFSGIVFLMTSLKIWSDFTGAANNDSASELRKTVFLIIAFIVTLTKCICDLGSYFILSKSAGFLSAFHSFSWGREWFLGVLLFCGFLSLFSRETVVPPKVGLAVISFGLLEYIAGIYTFMCGLWGTEAFRAATEVFRFTWNDLILNHEHMVAALTLLHIQGKAAFYLLFGLAPIVLLFSHLRFWHHPSNDDAKSTRKLRAGLMSAYLAVLVVTVAVRNYDAGYFYYHILHRGSPIDARWFDMKKATFDCTQQAEEQPRGSDTACYQSAVMEWGNEETRLDGLLLSQLNPKSVGGQAYLKEDHDWKQWEHNYLYNKGKNIGDNPRKKVMLLEEQQQVIEKHMDNLRDQAEHTGYRLL